MLPSRQLLRTLCLALFTVCLAHTFLPHTTASSVQVGGEVSWDAPAQVQLNDASWQLENMQAIHAAPHQMTERELFEESQTATGLPPPETPPMEPGLNLVCTNPPTLYYCRPTNIPNIHIELYPNDTDSLNAIGTVNLVLDAQHGTIYFSVTDGVTFGGDGSVDAVHIEMSGSLASMNAALTSLLFYPDYNFFGYASIDWQLSNTGTYTAPNTKGVITIVVGSIDIVPVLTPLAKSGVLAGFEMMENTVSASFDGVAVTDGKATSQTIYQVTIQSFEGSLNLATTTGLTFTTQTANLVVFTCLPDAMNPALASFTFSSSAYGPYSGNAGFVISVLNTFHTTSGFIQGSITNKPNQPKTVAGVLPAPVISAIHASSATATWQAVPDGFVASANQPAPSSYILQVSPRAADGSASSWATVYSGTALTFTFSSLNPGSDYLCQVIPVNSGGNGTPSPSSRFTTMPNSPFAPSGLTVASFSFNSVTLKWSPPQNTGGGSIATYQVVSQQSENVGTQTGIFTAVATASATPSYTVSGLAAGVSYTFYVTANNGAGSSGPSNSVVQVTLGMAPRIISYTASGPDSDPNTYSANVVLTIGFNTATNTPDVSSTAAINALFTFQPSIGAAYTGTWTDAQTLTIHITDAGSAAPTIGLATVHVIGGITGASGNTPASTSTSPALTGSFGTTGTLGGKVLVTKGDGPLETAEGASTSLNVGLDLTTLDANGDYVLVASVITPLLPGSFLHGTGFSADGLVVSVEGNPAAIQAALNTLIYTPAPGYTGPVSVSIKLMDKATSTLLASLITSITVTASASLPTVTAPETVDVILEQYTAISGVQVGSTDMNNVAGALFTVLVSTSHTGSSMFSDAAAGVQYSPDQGTESNSHELIGTIAALNAALAKLQAKFTFSTNSATGTFAPDPYTISVEIDDMSSTSSGTVSRAIRSISATINCNTASVPAANILSAQMGDTGNFIDVTIDKPVSDAYLSTPVFDCSTMLDSASVALLGDSPVCHWISTLTFRLDLGMGAKFVPGTNTLTIVPNGLQRCFHGTNSSPGATIQVAGPAMLSVPTVFISGPSVTSLCNTLVLQGITAMVGGRMPTFNWQLPRTLNPSFVPADLTTPILEIDPRAFGDGGDFNFTLTITNFLGTTSSVATKTVKATSLPIPLIFPTSVTEVDTYTTQTIRIYNSITSNPCSTEPIRPFTFQWTITPAMPTGSSGVALDTANLIIPRNSLTPNTIYTAVLRVAIASNTALYSEITYTINVQPSPLHARVAGGSWRKVRLDAKQWTIDASVSVDEDALALAAMIADQGRAASKAAAAGTAAPTTVTMSPDYAADKYTYMWSCQSSDGSACYSAIDGTPYLFTTSQATLTFPANAFKVGQYQFNLVYTHTPSGRQDTTSVLIQIREGVNPTAYGAAGTVDVLLDTVEYIVNPQGKLHLFASLPAYYSDRTDDIVYTWEVLGGGATPLNIDDPTNVQGMNTSSLILNPHELAAFFVPGTDYHFKVTASHIGDIQASADAGSAMVYVKINSLPVCDSFITSNTDNSAVAFNSTITVNAVNCYDPDTNDLLNYQFFRLDEQGNHFDLLPNSHSPLGRVPLLPTGADTNSYALTLGVTVADNMGGSQEYTKDLKVSPNSQIRSTDSTVIDGVAVLKSMYANTWAPTMAITGDSEMLLVIIAAILTEVNELAASSSFSSANLQELIDFKNTLLTDISSHAAILPSVQVLQSIHELIEDITHMDINLLSSALQFVSTRAASEPGLSTDQELIEDYVQVTKAAFDYVISTTGVVTASGGSRRLFSQDTSNMVGRQLLQSTSATPMSIVSQTYALMNQLAADISGHALMVNGEVFPINLKNTPGLVGAVGRNAVGQAFNISSTDGSAAIASASSFASSTVGSSIDLAVITATPAPYIGLITPAEAATIISGGASLTAYTPVQYAESTPITSWTAGDVLVEIPFTQALSACVQGDYVNPTNDNAASGNVFGNMCDIGCKVWNGNAFTTDGVTISAVHPLSKRAVCSTAAPGLVVVYSTQRSSPYVIPADPNAPADGSDHPKFQPNGLPWGVVRASMAITPSPTIFDLNAFKGQILQDLATVLTIPASRMVVQAVSNSGQTATIIWDFLVPTSDSTQASQDLYNTLISKNENDVASTVYMKNVQLDTISELCDDSVYRHQCSSGSSSWPAWELPVIIAVCCFVVLCCIGSIIFACIKCRRRPQKLQPDLVVVGDNGPAKKFVYTAPNSEKELGEESISDITIRPSGQEFEPSTHSLEEGSKNRLSAKFPNKSPAGAAGAAAAEQSQSSHHFYYVDESKANLAEPSGTGLGRRSSRSGGAAFTVEGSQSREISTSSSASTGSRAAAASDSPSAQRKQSLEDDKDKAALPVVRPSKSPKK